jgi:nucleotide-binding universal stress UspA family protein
MTTRTIVVGTDGSHSSQAAVRWAAHEAVRRQQLLRIVHVFESEWAEIQYDRGSEHVDLAEQRAEAVMATAAGQARAAAPTVRIEVQTLIGRAAPELLKAAETAELTVLGNRGRSEFASLLLGSVSQRVATHAAGPVAIVRGRGDVTDGPIAVGVDGSSAAEHVLDIAFELAVGRDCPLSVIRSYLPPVPLWVGDVPAADLESLRGAAERAALDELLEPWRTKYPQVPVEAQVSRDSAAAVLEAASCGAQLVVVGSRGHGAITGTMLGSTGVELLHHANCPVLIARDRPYREAAF